MLQTRLLLIFFWNDLKVKSDPSLVALIFTGKSLFQKLSGFVVPDLGLSMFDAGRSSFWSLKHSDTAMLVPEKLHYHRDCQSATEAEKDGNALPDLPRLSFIDFISKKNGRMIQWTKSFLGLVGMNILAFNEFNNLIFVSMDMQL